MQARVSFNSGELSPELSCRADLDQYGRGLSKLENWEVSQLGGVKRRRGMRLFAAAMGNNSRLVPYIYTYANVDGMRYLVEAQNSAVRVLSEKGQEVSRFESGRLGFSFFIDLQTLHYKQINRLLVLTSSTSEPLVLEYDKETWAFRKWEFRNLPWRYNHDEREQSISITKTGDDYNVVFDAETPDSEKENPTFGEDYLRASFYVEQQESGYSASRILQGVTVVTEVPATAHKGDKFAILGKATYKCFTCIDTWQSASNYREGLESPENYTQNFIAAAENDASFDSVTAVRSVKGNNYSVNNKVKLLLQNWLYWECTEDFTKTAGHDAFEDYPSFFREGIAASDALTCRGSWSSYCSGLWYGEYKVLRNYETADFLSADWRSVGISTSNLTKASNLMMSGNEADEECYLRLVVTKSRALSASDVTQGFISDSCQNRLIVSEYKHDEILRVSMLSGTAEWTRENKVEVPWTGERAVRDWSWRAFSQRYGYPIHCDVFNSRLVFAATVEQPQTLWLSRVDDLGNFLTGSVDDAAMYLTLSTTSQNPICWLQAQGSRIMFGTSESEFAISGGQAMTVTNKNVRATDHSHVGSDPVTALAVIDKVLYVERGAGRVYEFGYNLETDGYISRDLSVLAPHIMQEHGGVLRAALLRKPDTVAVFALGDGQLALCTYNAHQEVKAWHRWVTDGRITEVCVLPDGRKQDRLFLVVDRKGEACIEVVDGDSAYQDNKESDYVSTLITNPLNNFNESYVRNKNNTAVKIKFGAEFYHVGHYAMRISTNGGETWDVLDDTRDVVPAGWQLFYSLGEWNVDKQVGIEVRGKRGCHIIGLQA